MILEKALEAVNSRRTSYGDPKETMCRLSRLGKSRVWQPEAFLIAKIWHQQIKQSAKQSECSAGWMRLVIARTIRFIF